MRIIQVPFGGGTTVDPAAFHGQLLHQQLKRGGVARAHGAALHKAAVGVVAVHGLAVFRMLHHIVVQIHDLFVQVPV